MPGLPLQGEVHGLERADITAFTGSMQCRTYREEDGPPTSLHSCLVGTFIQFTSLLQFTYPVHVSHSSSLHLSCSSHIQSTYHIHPTYISCSSHIQSTYHIHPVYISHAIRIPSPPITFIQFTSFLQFAYPVHVSHIRTSHIQITNYIIRYPVLHSIPGEERASEMFVLAAGDTAHGGRQIIPAAQTFTRASFTCSPKSPPLRPSRG